MTALARSIDQPTDMFQQDFSRHAADLPGSSLEWLNARRRAAMAAFATRGIPNRRFEAWKYTDLAGVLDQELQPQRHAPPLSGVNRIWPVSGSELIFTGGFLRQISNDGSIEVFDLANLDARFPAWIRESLGALASGPDQPMGALSLALMRGGAAIRVHRNASLGLTFMNPAVGRAVASHSRLLIIVERGVALRLIESHLGDAAQTSLRNIGVELVLKAGSNVDHIRLQRDSRDAIHITTIGTQLHKDARYRGIFTAIGSLLSRVDARLFLGGENSEAALHNLAVLAAGTADITTVIDHVSPNSRSRQLFKSVVGGSGRSVSQGRVVVREGAVKSDSHQLFRALLLSTRAEADARPELEILADDVLCGHGTAIGALDPDAQFYLQSRGIPEREAQLLLIRAFVAEVLDGLGDEEALASLWRELEPELEQAGAAGQ